MVKPRILMRLPVAELPPRERTRNELCAMLPGSVTKCTLATSTEGATWPRRHNSPTRPVKAGTRTAFAWLAPP